MLLDLVLREVDGIELMRQVPELSNLPAIFISGYGRDEIPVARNVWQHVEGGSPAAAARRLIIARTTRRSSARPVSRRPAGSTVWKSAAFGSLNSAASR